jgi:hypothetical protein
MLKSRELPSSARALPCRERLQCAQMAASPGKSEVSVWQLRFGGFGGALIREVRSFFRLSTGRMEGGDIAEIARYLGQHAGQTLT